MKIKLILSILFRYLRGEAHYRFLSLFNQLLNEFSAVKTVVAPFYTEFSTLLAQEKDIVDMQKSSDYTQQISAADHRDDWLITGINDAVRAALHHYDPTIVAAARSVWLRLKAFGEIQAKSYEEEAAAIDLLVEDLRSSEFATKISQLGLTGWVNELATAVADFERLLKLRNVEQSVKPQQRLREVRRQLESVYRNMIAYITSAAMLNTSGTYTTFIDRLNAQITYFNEHNHHPAPRSIRTATVEVIPVQTYTGKDITPIPIAYLDGEELFFAKDFTLTYKNNIQPGTAEATLTGKGDYTGQKTVTFNII
jgi:hypothetical protein